MFHLITFQSVKYKSKVVPVLN